MPRKIIDFVLTADLDWASDYCIENFLRIADRYSVKPTLFVTHDSQAVARAARERRAELAIHPNFVAGSSHGATPAEVIDHVLNLVPGARSVRCHRYHGGPQIEEALARRGLRYDSNACRHLETGLMPERLPSGLLRLPVFFEDDIHWTGGLAWDFPALAPAFFSPGLKILNFHPFFVALNIPDAAFYSRHKVHIPTLTEQQAKAIRHRGMGTEDFLIELLESILTAGHRFRSLGELIAANPGWQAPSPVSPPASVN